MIPAGMIAATAEPCARTTASQSHTRSEAEKQAAFIGVKYYVFSTVSTPNWQGGENRDPHRCPGAGAPGVSGKEGGGNRGSDEGGDGLHSVPPSALAIAARAWQ